MKESLTKEGLKEMIRERITSILNEETIDEGDDYYEDVTEQEEDEVDVDVQNKVDVKDKEEVDVDVEKEKMKFTRLIAIIRLKHMIVYFFLVATCQNSSLLVYRQFRG